MLIEELCRMVMEAATLNKFTDSTLLRYKRTLNRLLDFANSNGYDEYNADFKDKYINECIYNCSGTAGKYAKKDRVHLMNLFDDYLSEGIIAFKTHKLPMLQPKTAYYRDLLNDFVKHLNTKNITHSTIMSYRYPVRCLFQYLETINIKCVDNLKINHLQGFLDIQSSQRNNGGLRNCLCGLRAFALFTNRIDLHNFFKSIRIVREKHIIPFIQEDETDRLWEHINSKDVSFRDKAIILLCLTYGIRASDIINLKFENIDWNTNKITFNQKKTGNVVTLPMLSAIGNALFDYITEERPKISDNTIFLRSLAPYKPLTEHSAIYALIRKACRKCNISFENRVGGTTLFRHNAASQLLRNSIPQSTIAAVLGHANPDTTNIYITTDEENLRKCNLSVLPLFKEGYRHE